MFVYAPQVHSFERLAFQDRQGCMLSKPTKSEHHGWNPWEPPVNATPGTVLSGAFPQAAHEDRVLSDCKGTLQKRAIREGTVSTSWGFKGSTLKKKKPLATYLHLANTYRIHSTFLFTSIEPQNKEVQRFRNSLASLATTSMELPKMGCSRLFYHLPILSALLYKAFAICRWKPGRRLGLLCFLLGQHILQPQWYTHVLFIGEKL